MASRASDASFIMAGNTTSMRAGSSRTSQSRIFYSSWERYSFTFPPEIIFAVITDIAHRVDWVVEPVELVRLLDGPAKLGTKWERNADRLGKKLVILNTCNIYEKNRKFGWKSEAQQFTV